MIANVTTITASIAAIVQTTITPELESYGLIHDYCLQVVKVQSLYLSLIAS